MEGKVYNPCFVAISIFVRGLYLFLDITLAFLKTVASFNCFSINLTACLVLRLVEDFQWELFSFNSCKNSLLYILVLMQVCLTALWASCRMFSIKMIGSEDGREEIVIHILFDTLLLALVCGLVERTMD